MTLAFTGLEDKASRTWTFQENEHKHSPAVGTYETDYTPFSDKGQQCGVYPPFGSYSPRDMVNYIYNKAGRDTPDTIYDVRDRRTKDFPKITSVFRDEAPRFRPLKATKLAPCDHSPIAVWLPPPRPKRAPNARARNKTVALLLDQINKASLEKNRSYYNGPKVSARGRANGYTIDAEGNVFEKSGDAIPHRKITAAGCIGPAAPVLQRFCGGNFSRSGRPPMFKITQGPGPAEYNVAAASENETNEAQKDTPGVRESRLFKEKVTKRKAQAIKNSLVGTRVKNIVGRHEKLLDQYLKVLDDVRHSPIGFNSTTTRETMKERVDMDIPAVTAHTDNRSAIQTDRPYRKNCDPDEGFLMKSPRFPQPAKGDEPAYGDPPPFLNMRQQIHQAQIGVYAAFGSTVPRASPFAKKDITPATSAFVLPTSIEVSVRNDRPPGKDKHAQFPWQGWRAKESGFKRYLDRVPPPGWYNVAKAFKLSTDKRTFHRPSLATCPPAVDSSTVRKSDCLLAAVRPTPAPNRYNCNKWWKPKKVRHHGATFPKAPYRSLFDVKPTVAPGPAHHIATILASSIAQRSFNA